MNQGSVLCMRANINPTLLAPIATLSCMRHLSETLLSEATGIYNYVLLVEHPYSLCLPIIVVISIHGVQRHGQRLLRTDSKSSVTACRANLRRLLKGDLQTLTNLLLSDVAEGEEAMAVEMKIKKLVRALSQNTLATCMGRSTYNYVMWLKRPTGTPRARPLHSERQVASSVRELALVSIAQSV